jgi:predicted Zn-dependent protease
MPVRNLGWQKRLQKRWHRSQFSWRSTLRQFIAIGAGLLIAVCSVWLAASAIAQAPPTQVESLLPAPQAHVLPQGLANWRDVQQQGDYFAAIEPTRVGYLVWSRFPITVFIEPVASDASTPTPTAPQQQAQIWVEAVTQAIDEWNQYLPLMQVESAAEADIAIWRSSPALVLGEADSQNPGRSVRARSAETRYEVYVDRDSPSAPILSHRFTILLRPSQTADYLRAAARHELGHALGIWGHSPIATDALYFSQVRNPPSISARDINTLKRIYEQPTRLGWAIELEDNVP